MLLPLAESHSWPYKNLPSREFPRDLSQKSFYGSFLPLGLPATGAPVALWPRLEAARGSGAPGLLPPAGLAVAGLAGLGLRLRLLF